MQPTPLLRLFDLSAILEGSLMKSVIAAAVAALCLPAVAWAAPVTHFAPTASPVPGQPTPPLSTAVMAGDTLYVSGVLDIDPVSRQPAQTAEAGARIVLDALKRGVEAGGLTMNDLVYVQIFATDLTWFAKFNEVYRTYFTGPFPARAFIGTSQLLSGAHFEIVGVAVRK